MNRYFLGLLVAGAAGGFAAACVKDPTASIRTNTPSRITPSNRFLTISVGDSARVSVQAMDDQGNALADPVTATSLDQNTVSTSAAPPATPLPQTNFYIKAKGFGAGRVEVALGTLRDTIRVNTLPATLRIGGQSDTLLRSGVSVQLSAEPLGANGVVIAGVAPVTWVSSNPAAATVTATGLVTGRAVGIADITLTVPGATTRISYQVVAGVPASARFNLATFGAVPAAGTSVREVQVLDALGNQNRNLSEIQSVTINSSAPGVATVATAITDNTPPGTRQISVTATGVGSGSANISGSVTTTNGVFALPTASVTVLNPQVTSTALTSGPGATVSITGTGLSATGFPTTVVVRVHPDTLMRLGNVTVVSPTQVDVRMPTLGTAGTFDFRVSVGGVLSNVGAWTQTGTFDEQEAVNDDPATAPAMTLPFTFSGAFEGAPEYDDFFVFTLTSNATVRFRLDWSVAAKDVDWLITDTAVTQAFCVVGATAAKPEVGNCNLVAGTYLLWVNDYSAVADDDPTPTTYTITGRIQ